MNLARRTGRNIAWTAVGDIMVKAATVAITIYLARVLGVESFGLFGLAIAIVSAIWPVIDLGVSGYGTRAVARDHSSAEPMLRSLNSMRIVAAILAIAIVAIVLQIQGAPPTETWVILSATLYLVGFSLCPDWIVRGLERMNWLAVINGATAIALVVGVLVFVHGPDDIIIASAIRALSFAAGSLIGLIALWRFEGVRFGFSVRIAEWIALIKEMFVFLLNRVATNFGQFLPLFAVTYVLGELETGLFAAPHRLYIIGLTGLAAITTAIYPVLSSLYQESPEKFHRYQKQVVRYLLLLFVPVGGVGIVGADSLVTMIFGVEYADAGNAFAVMLVTLVFVSMRAIYVLTLLSAGLERYSYVGMILALIFQAIALYFLVPSYGIFGGALAMCMGEIAACVFLITASVRRGNAYLPIDGFVLALLVAVAILIILATFFSWNAIQIFLFGLPIYLFLIVLFRLVSVSELRRLNG